jgi:hypothetical protein
MALYDRRVFVQSIHEAIIFKFFLCLIKNEGKRCLRLLGASERKISASDGTLSRRSPKQNWR